MKILRNLLLIVLVLSLTLGLFACRRSPEGEGESESADNVGTTPAVDPISFLDCDIVRAENMPKELENRISEMYMALINISKGDNEYSTDVVSEDTGKKEILVGHTNRPETEQVLSQLEVGAYTVAVVGNKVVIVGFTENLTSRALDYFLDTYLVDGTDGMLEGDLFYSNTVDVAVIVDKGEPKYTLVSNDQPYLHEQERFDSMATTVKTVTGITFPTKTDAQEDETAPEILFGYLSYEQTQAMKSKVNPDSYCIEFVGNKLVVYSWTIEGLDVAASALKEMLIFGCYTEADGTNTIVIPKDDSVTAEALDLYAEVPYEVNGVMCTRAWNVHDGGMLLYWEDANEGMLTKYAEGLIANGFTKHQELNNTSIRSVTFFKDKAEVCIYYLKRVKEFRVATQDNATLPLNAYEYTKVCDPIVTQINLLHNNTQYIGMSYLIRLEDGSFVVIDGGVGGDDNTKRLYDEMRNQMLDKTKKIEITAWFMTHGHGDHYGVFRTFFSNYKNQATLKYFVANDLSDVEHEGMYSRGFEYSSWAAKWPGCKYMKIHAGQQLFFPGVTFTILGTHEDLIQKEDARNYNDNASTTFAAVINGEATPTPVKEGQTRFLWFADAEPLLGERLYKMYENDLACDVMQLGHHGLGGCDINSVKAANPDIVFWPCGAQVMGRPRTQSWEPNRWLLDREKADEIEIYWHYVDIYRISFEE